MVEFPHYDPILLAISGHSSINEQHLHSVSQLSVPKNGVMYINVNRRLYIIPPGMAIFIPANTLHGMQKAGSGGGMESIYFETRYSQQLPWKPVVLGLSSLAITVISKICKLYTKGSISDRVDRLLSVLVDEINDSSMLNYSLPIPEEHRLAKLYQIFCKSNEYYPSLKEAASQVNVSPRTLERLFQREFGISFSLWKQRFIFVRALELLQRYKRVTDVAYQLGYNSDSAFITMFKKMSGGQTPTQFLFSKE